MQQFTNTKQGKRPARQYFLKDKKAMVYNSIPLYKKTGWQENPDHYYKAISDKELWCYTRQISQEQFFLSVAYGIKEVRYFVFNFREDIKVYDRILYKGELYEITRTDRQDDYNGDIFAYVKYVEMTKNSTTDDKLRPFEWNPEDEGFSLTQIENVSESDTGAGGYHKNS